MNLSIKCQTYCIVFAGAIFREDQRVYELAFKFAIHKINKDPRILPKSLLTYDIQYVDKDDSFHANKQGLCDLFSFIYIVCTSHDVLVILSIIFFPFMLYKHFQY